MTDVTLSTLIDSTYPSDGATSIPLRATVWVIFDTEMDEDSIEDNFFLEGPNTENFSGPDLTLWNRGTEYVADKDALFTSLENGGAVEGEITFERVQTDSASAYSGLDYSGAGSLYRTKAVFTPTRPLVASTSYYITLSGGDSAANGLRKRSVFDTRKVSGSGTGTSTVSGSYTGSADDTYTVEIVGAGAVGTATYKWYRASNPVLQFGPYNTQLKNQNMADGVKVLFGESGSFSVGDKFTCVVKVPDEATGIVQYSFTSGSGSILTVPTAASTSVLGLPTDSASDDYLEVSRTSPGNRSSRVALAKVNPIQIYFNNTLDASTVTLDRVTVTAEAVVDDPDVDVPNSADDLPKRITVSGNVLTIYI